MPAFERAKTVHALDGEATATGIQLHPKVRNQSNATDMNEQNNL
jgi:hypothetical protein